MNYFTIMFFFCFAVLLFCPGGNFQFMNLMLSIFWFCHLMNGSAVDGHFHLYGILLQ